MTMRQNFSRRAMLVSGLSAAYTGMVGCKTNAATPLFNLQGLSSEQKFQTFIKTIGTLQTEDIYIWFKGVLWGVLPQQTPVAFCGFQGLARHRWIANSDGSFTQKAYDVGFFCDLETGLPIDELENPFTNEKLTPYHNKYGGFPQIHTLQEFEKNSKKYNWYSVGDRAVLTERSSGSVSSKMQPNDWPRETSGTKNYYGGESSYVTSLNQLSDPKISKAEYTLFWSSFSPWEPWLLMDGRGGTCQWRATGVKLQSYKDAPSDVLDFVKKDQPNYFEEADPWEGYLSNTDRYMRDRKPA